MRTITRFTGLNSHNERYLSLLCLSFIVSYIFFLYALQFVPLQFVVF